MYPEQHWGCAGGRTLATVWARLMPHQGLPQPGDVVAGKYIVERFLGRGGMGAVYVVNHRLTGKRLALKCLLPEHLEHADIVERFMREAQAAGRIQHRHVVDVFDVGHDDSLLYIVMEHLEGKPFSELLHDEALTLEETLGILVRAMEGVAAAHALGTVHRDLKPDNIFVCVGTSGRLDDPRVLDFGISKVDDDAGRSLTRSGVAMGTPYYMSLEQMSGQRDLDVRVDVYAMGVILYEAISGQPPHVADSVSALAIRMLTTPAVHLGQIRPDLPAGLSDVVMKALARDREHRYPTMQALIDAIRPFVPQGAGLLVPEGQGRPLRTPRSSASPVKTMVPAAAPTTPSGPSPVPGFEVGSAATLAAPTTPKSAAVQAELATERVPPARSKGLSPALALIGALVLSAVGLSVWWFGMRSPSTHELPSVPGGVTPVSAEEARTPPPLPTREPAVVAPTEPAPLPVGEATPEPEPSEAKSAGSRHGSRRHGEKGKSTEKQPETPTGTAPTPDHSAVKGRAGELAPEEF